MIENNTPYLYAIFAVRTNYSVVFLNQPLCTFLFFPWYIPFKFAFSMSADYDELNKLNYNLKWTLYVNYHKVCTILLLVKLQKLVNKIQCIMFFNCFCLM